MSKTKTTCMVPGCEAVVSARGNCSSHYNRLRHLVNRSKEDDEPVTWELLVDTGLAAPRRGRGPRTSEFIIGVLAALAEHRRSEGPTS